MEETLQTPSEERQLRFYEQIKFECKDGVARILLNRPQVNNAMNTAMLEEVSSVLDSADMSMVKILILDGGDRAFSSGLDLSEHAEDKAYQLLDGLGRIVRRLLKIDPVSISVVRGMALGAGCELAAVCDFCFAAEDAKLGQPEIKAGIFAPIAAVAYPRLIGLRRTFEMLMTGRIYTAKEAERIGLITRAVPANQLDQEIQRWIEFLRGFSSRVLCYTRQAIATAATLPFDEALHQVEELYLNELMATDDAREGLRAVLEKRRPVWKDR